MATETGSQEGRVEHIGAAPHPTRNRLVLGGGAVIALLLGAYYLIGGRADKAAAAELDRFRQAVFEKCKLDSFKGPTDPQLAGLYVDSSRMRTVVGEQLGALDRGQASCDQVIRSLRSVDYPVP